MVNLPRGQEVSGLYGVRSLFQGAILSILWLVRLNGLSVQITMTLTDNGCGFLPHTVRGIGLDSMRRRAQALGAQLAVDSTPGQGTCVRLAWAPRSSPAPDTQIRMNHTDALDQRHRDFAKGAGFFAGDSEQASHCGTREIWGCDGR